MRIEIKHLGQIDNRIGYIDRDTLTELESIQEQLMATAARLPQELEARDMSLTSQKLTDTAQADIGRLNQSIAAFAATLRAVNSNYQQAQIRTLERIIKISY